MDFLELVWVISLEQNEQHQELMETISEDILEQMLRSVLLGKGQSAETLSATLASIGRADLTRGYYVVLVWEIFCEENETIALVEQELFQRSLLRILNAEEGQDMVIEAVPMDLLRVAVILRFSSEISAFRMRAETARVEQSVLEKTRTLPYRVMVGRGSTCTGLTDVQQSYFEAAEQIRYQKYQEKIPEGETEEKVPTEEFTYVKLVRHAYTLAKEGQLKESLESCRNVLEEIRRREADPGASWRRLVDDMMEKLISCRIGQEEISTAGVQRCVEEFRKAENDRDAELYLTEFYRTALPLIWESSRKSNNHYVQKAKEYISEHYAEGTLTAQEISAALGITNSYLSSIFTEGTGTGLNAWMNDYRIRQALRYMEETSLNISEIGYKCGFNSAQSFTRVFKKHTGMSPKQYRETHHLGQEEGRQ